MRVINFLPDDYLQQCTLHRANLACLVVAGGALLALGGAFAYTSYQAVYAGVERAAVEAQYAEASRQIAQLKQLEDRKTGLLHKVELSTALLERVPRSHLLAKLTNYLPAHTSLTSITMRIEDVSVRPTEAAAGAGGKADAAAPKKSPGGRDEMVKVKRVRFRLDGLATTDIDVAEFLMRLSADPLFDEVDLQFSEEFAYGDGSPMRRFQLSFRLSAAAEKILETAAAPTAPEKAKGAS
jgi:Tfp pilus assembly protein PilN